MKGVEKGKIKDKKKFWIECKDRKMRRWKTIENNVCFKVSSVAVGKKETDQKRRTIAAGFLAW